MQQTNVCRIATYAIFSFAKILILLLVEEYYISFNELTTNIIILL